MKAGVDFGSSLVKAYWRKNISQYNSSAELGVNGLAEKLRQHGVTHINATGIGPRTGFEGFVLAESAGDPLAAEIGLQAKGLRHLYSVNSLPQRLLLVSIGTGTSYTEVDGDKVAGTRLGNPMGGGFIAGFGRIFMMGEPERIAMLAANGTPPDTLMKHSLPALGGSPMGEFVISHFNRAEVTMEEADFAAGLLHCVAVSIIRDLMADVTPDVVFIGSTVAAYSTLEKYLKSYCAMLGKTAHFPTGGEYAGALGAYYRDE